MENEIEGINKRLKVPGLKVLEILPGKGRKRVRAECGCGKEFETRLKYIKSGNTTSCGCRRHRTIQYYEIDWKEVVEKGAVRCKKDRNGDRRTIVYQGVTCRFSMAVWNANHPDNLVGPNEVIHHKDRNKLNDEIENLQKMTKAEHARLHRRNKDTGSMIKFDLGVAIVLRQRGKTFREVGEILRINRNSLESFFFKHRLSQKIKDRTIWEWCVEYQNKLKASMSSV